MVVSKRWCLAVLVRRANRPAPAILTSISTSIFASFPEVLKSTWKIQKTFCKRPFSSDMPQMGLHPPSLKRPFHGVRAAKAVVLLRLRKISPEFSCIEFRHFRDVPTQSPGHPCHFLSKTTEKGHLHKVFVRNIPTFFSGMSQDYPCPKNLCLSVFPFFWTRDFSGFGRDKKSFVIFDGFPWTIFRTKNTRKG